MGGTKSLGTRLSQDIFVRTAQLASYFAQDGLFDTSMSLELMPNAKHFFSVSEKSSVFTATVRAYGVIGFLSAVQVAPASTRASAFI